MAIISIETKLDFDIISNLANWIDSTNIIAAKSFSFNYGHPNIK